MICTSLWIYHIWQKPSSKFSFKLFNINKFFFLFFQPHLLNCHFDSYNFFYGIDLTNSQINGIQKSCISQSATFIWSKTVFLSYLINSLTNLERIQSGKKKKNFIWLKLKVWYWSVSFCFSNFRRLITETVTFRYKKLNRQ